MMRRHWAIVLAAVCLAVVIGAVAYGAGQAKSDAPEVIRAQRFEVVDAKGNVRAVLDGANLLLADEKGEVRAVLSMFEGSPGLSLHNEKGETRAVLALLTDGRPYLGLSDEKGKERAVLALLTDGRPGLALFDKEGKALFSAPDTAGMGAEAAPRANPGGPVLDALGTPKVIESHIDGEFEGWSGETIFKLANGQVWQQAAYAYIYHYAYSPEVLIYQTAGGYKMRVDGVDDTIRVERLK